MSKTSGISHKSRLFMREPLPFSVDEVLVCFRGNDEIKRDQNVNRQGYTGVRESQQGRNGVNAGPAQDPPPKGLKNRLWGVRMNELEGDGVPKIEVKGQAGDGQV